MKTINYRVTAETYKAYREAKTYGEQLNIIEPTLTREIVLGYGFYGCGRAFEENGKQYVEIRIGSTCD